ncbi:MAG TPA: hypothetical protein VHN20_01130 [Beijerinckiaceae bacterium]|nr:hypothetical protein [Beijerinckiaceae bacterium]
MTRLAALLVAALLGSAGAGKAQPTAQDWPCVQRKVPTIAAGAIWAGPDPAAAADWGRDAAAAALAQKLAARRTALDEADQLIDAFAAAAGSEREQRLTRVFAGVLELINLERSRVIEAIERYARGQRRLADRVRDESDRLSAVKDSPGAQGPADDRALETEFFWDKRIFEERSQALPYVCEAPVILEQRLFELARKLQQRL